MRRAATSVYATLGVAAATLIAVGAIIAGPAIIECSREGALGACLRDKLDDSGLTSPALLPSDPPPPGGWMEAVANEYEPPQGTPVELEGTPADLLADAVAPSSSAATEVSMVPAADLATLAPAQEEVPVSVALVGPMGELSADAAPVGPLPGPDNPVVLSQPEDGILTAAMSSELAVDVAVAVEPVAPADGLTSAVAPPSSEPALADLSAVPAPLESSSEPATSSEMAVPSSAPIVVEFNPTFPNVIVLPPPTTGDDSSFRSLQLN